MSLNWSGSTRWSSTDARGRIAASAAAAVLNAQVVAPTAGEGGAMDDGVGGTEEAEQELLAALTPVEENKATDGENPPTWIGTGFQRLLGKQKRKKKKTQWRRRGELAHGEVRPGALAFVYTRCAFLLPTAIELS